MILGPLKAAEGRRSPKPGGKNLCSLTRVSVLECASPLALFPKRVMFISNWDTTQNSCKPAKPKLKSLCE